MSLSSHTMRSTLARSAIAAIAGLAVYASYAPLGWFFAAPLGLALLCGALAPWKENRPSNKTGAFLGFIYSITLFLLLLPWIGEFVGAMPYIALSTFLSLYSIPLGIVGVRILRHRLGWVWFPFVFVAVEWARSNFPFGGFAWVRIAWGQIDGPLAGAAPWGGPALVSLLTALVGAALWQCVTHAAYRRQAASVMVTVLLVAGVATLTNGQAEDQGTVKVAAVQGNVPRLGLDFNAQRRAVLANHVRETEKIPEQPDLVIWPENSSDVSPFSDQQAKQLVSQAVAHAQAPILVGTITKDNVGHRNSMVVFDPRSGVGETHNKKYLQPFGEYMPWRDFFRKLSPLVDLAGDFKPGNGNGVVHMTAATTGKNIAVGIATCYEVAFDKAGRDAVTAGAQILTTPTNNATFGFTDMTYQQLAMSRMRAIELDRAVVVAATSGVSALIKPDGSVISQTKIFQSATLEDTLPLHDTLTFSARYGTYIEYALVIIGTMCALWSLFFQSKSISRGTSRKLKSRTTKR
ncbi:apolipoprotein N-acyltransferase [Corynebacterium pseudotuberculosis]|uniref:Apolipoprotein N-acyltransferase n=1 Tax=Corynebacterium pseudotuberculosis (strain C231) TaxID=681645 RepID=D9QAB7_CORP2|nr:apolipoprotein N-acyltransferase [Corynebacterium pseudotuberculosis]ADK28814.1 apolipoprotein N-acyltransferase [Corynebacterium pseudotuberculosis FRC41]ADL10493.1 apolipoprotein N-acyltransferase [Corynebacterium pseudotuberculosis C231]ADL20902.2 apolipoprotein N-acyltransferase [Corynebacterium pseudotuberculosis 1002]ADO26290.2 apolipoprotein N-acyltransferase [Corynebacterium pseudotuberculosis I19]AEX39504.1 Apolipoprotein N-acyltransferase [Corynebacterium pseudotuberculosis 3/99-5